MPKQLSEIKNFNTGVILNASERDTAPDTPAFSLNVEASTEEGILDSIRTNRLVMSLQSGSNFVNPIPWGVSQISHTNDFLYNNSNMLINDIHLFEDREASEVFIEGIKGVREKLLVRSIEPV